MKIYTPDEIQLYASQYLEALRRDVPDVVWAEECASILTELHDLAGAPDRDADNLGRLQERCAGLLGEHKLEGLDPIFSMIASLKPKS